MPSSLGKRPKLGFIRLLLALNVVAVSSTPRPAAAEWSMLSSDTVAAWARYSDPPPESAVWVPQPREPEYRAYGISGNSERPARECRRSAWEAGVELTMLKPRFEDGAEEEWQRDVVDFGLRPGTRVWLSLTEPGGVAIRGRYWQFDHASEPRFVVHAPGPRYRICARVEAHAVDLELTQELKSERWSLLLGGGARYVMLQQTVQMTDGPDRWLKRLQAIGPTFALETQRATRLPHFSVFANLRGSLLSGGSRWANPSESQDTDDISSILEMQLGGEFHWTLPRRGALFLRGGWEQQIWLGAGSFFGSAGTAVGETLGIQPDDHDLGFMGFFVSLGGDW